MGRYCGLRLWVKATPTHRGTGKEARRLASEGRSQRRRRRVWPIDIFGLLGVSHAVPARLGQRRRRPHLASGRGVPHKRARGTAPVYRLGARLCGGRHDSLAHRRRLAAADQRAGQAVVGPALRGGAGCPLVHVPGGLRRRARQQAAAPTREQEPGAARAAADGPWKCCCSAICSAIRPGYSTRAPSCGWACARLAATRCSAMRHWSGARSRSPSARSVRPASWVVGYVCAPRASCRSSRSRPGDCATASSRRAAGDRCMSVLAGAGAALRRAPAATCLWLLL